MSTPRSGERLAGRYVLSEPIGEGASAIVFRGRDGQTATDVAVKWIEGPDAALRARREHELSADAHHPNLARALDVGRRGDAAFVVLELVDGEPFDRALLAADRDALVLAVDGLLSVLCFLHARGLVHGDLKPDNVRVVFDAGRPRTRLIDLGLARPPGERGGGNSTYGAPESLGGCAGLGSDLFSVGVMAYEVISGGALPFGDPLEPEYLLRLVHEPAAPLPSDVPDALGSFVHRLLAKDPAARYRTAADARAALAAAAPGDHSSEQAPSPPKLVQRGDAMARLRSALIALAEGGTQDLVLAGPPRSGRTRLLHHAMADARSRGLLTLSASARGGVAALLGQILDGARALGCDERELAAARSAIAAPRSIEGRHAHLLAVLSVLGGRSSRDGLLVAIDDVDRADTNTREAIRFLSASGAGRIGFVVADGPEAGAGAIEVCGLDVEGAEELISSMLPGLAGAGELAAIAHRATVGLAGEIVDGVLALVRADVVVFGEGRWQRRVDVRDPGEHFGALPLGLVESRVRALPDAARRDLAAIAVHGGDVESACAHLGLPAERTRATAARLRLVRERGGRFELASEDLREHLRASLTAEQTRAIREVLVVALDGAKDPLASSRRAEHLMALGRVPDAVGECLRAADAALADGDVHLGARMLARASEWGGEATSRRVAPRRAELLSAAGRVADALDVLDRAAGTDANPEISSSRGRVLARAGRYEEAIEALVGASEEDEDRFWLGWSLMMRGRYDEAETLAVPRSGAARSRARMGRLAGTIAWHRGDAERASVLLHAALEAAHESGDPLLEVEVAQSLGTAERIAGRFDEARKHYDRAIELARGAGFAPVLAKALNNLAILHYHCGRWTEAERAWEGMHELALRLDSREEVLLANNNLGLLFKDRGELERATRSLDVSVELAHGAGLTRYEAMALGNRAEVRILAGDHGAAARDLEACRVLADAIGATDEQIERLRRQAALSLATGSPESALSDARAAASASARIGASLEEGNALLVASAACRALGRLEESALLVAAARAAIEAGGTALEVARVDLEAARVAAARGDDASARRAAGSAARVFADLGAQAELAAARAVEDGGAGAERERALVELLRIAAGASDVDQLLAQVVEALLRITGAERGCVVQLEADEGPRILVRKSVDGTDADLPVLSRGIADRVVASRRALVLANIGDEAELASRESVVSLGLRAALCAPLMRADRCLGLLYVDSTRGPELVRFGLWALEAAAAIVVPAVERLMERDVERERINLLQSVAVDALETITAIDASLDLLLDEDRAAHRIRLVDSARHHVRGLTQRSEGVLDLLRCDDDLESDPEDEVSVRALIGCVLDAFSDEGPRIHVRAGESPAYVSGRLEPLASAIAGLVGLLRAHAGAEGGVLVRARPVSGDNSSDDSGWLPGQSAGRSFVRIEIAVGDDGRWPRFRPASAEALTLKAARRVLRRSGGRVIEDPEGRRLLLELLAVSKEAA